MMMNAHQLQQMQQLSQLAAHPSLVAQVQQQVAAAQQQQQQQQQVSHPSHGAADSDDSSGEEHYDLDDQLHKQAGKPWVPSIEDPNYFEDLSPEEIYDSFFSIRRMGFIANRIIRKLNETKHIVSSKILEKRKKLKAVQRKQFEQLSPAGVEYLKVLLKMEIAALKNTAQNVEAGLNPSPSIKCRLAHLAEDPASADILSKIYATDSSVRTLELWKLLAIEYVNNPAWQPKRSFIDERILDIDPSRPPEEKFSPEALRSVFSRLRIEYTKTILRFQTTIKPGAQQRDVQDTEFWERYAKHDKSMYYIYQIFFDRVPNNDCLMVDAALSRTDVDVDLHHVGGVLAPGPGASAAAIAAYNNALLNSRKREREAAIAANVGDDNLDDPHHGVGIDGLGALEVDQNGNPIKRVRDDLYNLGVVGGPAGLPNAGVIGSGSPEDIAWQTQIRKDRSVANYYRRLSINNEIRFQMEMLARENVGEAMKRNLKAKMNILLLKKVEDRYDDL